MPAVASAAPLTPRSVKAALDDMAHRKSALDIEKANPFLNGAGIAKRCQEEGAVLKPGEYRYLMERCIAEGATLDADTWAYLEDQPARDVMDKQYIYSETTKSLTAIPINRLETYRAPHQLGQGLDDCAEAYDGSELQKDIRAVSHGIGTVMSETVKAIALGGYIKSREELGNPVTIEEMRALSKDWDETKGPMQYVGEGLHKGAQKGFVYAGASHRSSEILATGTLDVVNIASTGKAVASLAKPLINPVLTTAKSGLNTALNVARNMEVTLDSTAFLRHNAGIPIDAVKIGQKTPKVDVPTPAPAPTAPKVAEATVSEAPVLASDQPWTVRPGQEYKLKVHGQAQVTGPGHEVRSYRVAIEEAKKPDTVRVHLDQGYKKVTGVDVKPNRRPDVTVVKEDGTVHATEVVSKTDDITKLQLRNEEAMSQLPEHMQGDINLVDYTRSHQAPEKGKK